MKTSNTARIATAAVLGTAMFFGAATAEAANNVNHAAPQQFSAQQRSQTQTQAKPQTFAGINNDQYQFQQVPGAYPNADPDQTNTDSGVSAGSGVRSNDEPRNAIGPGSILYKHQINGSAYGR